MAVHVESTAKRTEAIARWVALSVVVISMADQDHWRKTIFDPVLAMFGLILIVSLRGGDGSTLGLRLVPEQGWTYWLRVSIRFALLILLFTVAVGGVFLWLGWHIPVPKRAPTFDGLYWMCLYFPVVEEVIYRALLVTAIRPTFGDWGTILIGGIVFAAIHIQGGNVGPDNQIAGFLLTWAYLRSKSLLVPLAMHACGNLCAFSFQVATYQGWLPIL